MLRAPIASVLLLLLPTCTSSSSSSGSTPGGVPPEAASLQTRLASDMVRAAPLLGNIQSGLVAIMNPDAPAAQGVSFVPATGAGLPANTYDFNGAYDGNGDGMKETTLSGRVTLGSDPGADFVSSTGQATLDIKIPVIGHLYKGSIAFAETATDTRISGAGTFTNPLTSTTTTLTIPAASPLVIKAATGAPGEIANACGFSIDGTAQIQMASGSGTVDSMWVFAPGSATVAVLKASFKDGAGQVTGLPDATADLRCGVAGSLQDWAAVFDQDWACLPREHGKATITIKVTGPDTVSITDEDPPGSGDVNTYEAKLIGAGPHAVRGFFVSGPAGDRYREDFTWMLRKDKGFSQFSSYRYTEGPNAGKLGLCRASAKRR